MKKKLIGAYVCTQDCMGKAEGDLVMMDVDQAEALSDFVREATPEDMNGVPQDDGDSPAAGNENKPPVSASLEKSLDAQVERLTSVFEKAFEKSVAKVSRRPDLTVKAEVKDRTCGFKGLGDMLRCAAHARHSPAAQAKLANYDKANPRERFKSPAGADEGTNSDGGYLVIPDWADQIWSKVYDQFTLIEKCHKYEGSGNTVNIPTINETSRVDGSRFGGIVSNWFGEAATLTASKVGYGQNQLILNKLAMFLPFTNELLADSAYDINAETNYVASEELRFKINDALINGSGSGQPTGILNSAALVTVSKESGQSNATVVLPNLAKMYGRMWAPARSKSFWIVNQEVMQQLILMTFPNSSGTYSARGVSYDASSTIPMKIFGYPVFECENSAQLGNIGDILYVSLEDYGVFTKPLEVAVSTDFYFNTDQTVFRFTFRMDSKNMWASALTPHDGSSLTLSNVIALQSRGT